MDTLAYIQSLIAAIKRLNSLYGAGSVESIDLIQCAVTCKLQYGKRTYHYRISQDGKTVYYRNHQAKIA